MSTGAHLIARSLKQLGITTVFGIVGIPIVEVGDALLHEGVRFLSFRNEQAASYAASCYGYLSGQPGVLLVVGGPGIVHALAGVFNANANRWPLLVLAGSTGTGEIGKGAFQELDQVSMMSSWAKLTSKPLNVEQVPLSLLKAYKEAMFGTPGSTYVDLPADLIEAEIAKEAEDRLVRGIGPITPSQVPKFVPPKQQLENAAHLLATAKSPLVIIGKGAAYSNASEEIRRFVESHNLPFLPTPMGKGVVSDHSPLNVSSARSQALKSADVVLILGARLNWILHFGEPPRFRDDVKFIQVDTNAETLQTQHGLLGDIPLVVQELDSLLTGYTSPGISTQLQSTITKNNNSLITKETTETPQLNYNTVYARLRHLLAPRMDSTILVTEGANTMDVARISFPQNMPKTKLDAGTNATMGVGVGYAIAAKAYAPNHTVVAIEGDSAFGFSAMELETAVRFNLGMVVVVMNNSGIYHGVPEGSGELPSTALSKGTRYDLLGESLGCQGFSVETLDQVEDAFSKALNLADQGKVSVINVIIGPGTQKKIGFGWQNKKAKL